LITDPAIGFTSCSAVPLVVVLLAGGDKSSQDADIKTAIKIAKEWKD
jgi:putative component of toxin-antitoxin plasmid stabilization module